MADMFDYLTWRGDIPFSAVGPNPVDCLILSTLAYIDFRCAAPHTPYSRIPLEKAAVMLLADPLAPQKVRVDRDLELLAAAAATERFRHLGIGFCQDVFDPQADTQFAAMTFWLDDGTAVLAFRGTDNTLVGWKEDFNMTFLDHIPAQSLALEYVREFASVTDLPMRLGGHSKGGNLAVYAAAMAEDAVQDRILSVSNLDGPGFMDHIIAAPGYQRILPKIRTYVPQSSICGLLLEHEEARTVIQSSQLGLLQHDPYSWGVLGSDFVPDEQKPDSLFLDRTLRSWLAAMTMEERNAFFDAVFGLLMTDNTRDIREILRPQTLLAYVRSLKSNSNVRSLLTTELEKLLHSAKQVTGGKNNE